MTTREPPKSTTRLPDADLHHAALDQLNIPNPPTEPAPQQPHLLLLQGPPLSGKTTLSEHLQVSIPTAMVPIENDRLRPLIVNRLDDARDRFSTRESEATYQLAAHLARHALRHGWHVLHDATNLDPHRRSHLLTAADHENAPTLTLHVETPPEMREERARTLGPDALRAHRAIGDAPRPEPRTPTIRLDGTQPPAQAAARILEDPLFSQIDAHEDRPPRRLHPKTHTPRDPLDAR